MRNFDRIKTLQLGLLVIAAVVALLAVFRDADLYALIATDQSARLISIILWLVLGISFVFLLYDFSNYAHMKRENLQLDSAVHSDALTGVANRYSIDAYLGQFHDKPLPEDMGAMTLQITNLAEMNARHGHSAGDLEIQAFAGMLQMASDGACFIGRNGGNKFVVILRDCTRGRMDKFLSVLESEVKEYNDKQAAADSTGIRYSCGMAFNEGEAVRTVNELVALSDRRSRQ